jgi:hypothetical protein
MQPLPDADCRLRISDWDGIMYMSRNSSSTITCMPDRRFRVAALREIP